VWSLRGAPHLYRRADLPSVAAAVQPFSEADATKRILNASKPLKAAGITSLGGLDTVAEQMRAIVTEPLVKGAVSTALTGRLGEAYLHYCRPCGATHCYEMTFRLGALRGGLELAPGTSPPVLQRIPGHPPLASPLPQHDVIRACLRLLGPTTPRDTAGFLEAPLKDVTARWPEDTEQVQVGGEQRWVLADGLPALRDADATTTRLLGPFDLFLQGRDRDLLVSQPDRAKALWPRLGRPGAVLLGREVAGLWRPRQVREQARRRRDPVAAPVQGGACGAVRAGRAARCPPRCAPGLGELLRLRGRAVPMAGSPDQRPCPAYPAHA